MSDRYEITSLLEKNLLGDVFMALDVTLQRKVVFRKFEADSVLDLPEDFVQYTGKLCALQHPNLLTIYDIDRNDEGYFMVTQFIEAEALSDCLTQGALSEGGVYNMASDLLDALHAIHAAGICHGALSLDSVERLDRLRGGHRYFIVDLGLNKLSVFLSGSNTASLSGLEVMASPELLAGGEADPSSDLFALGQLCYMSLVGGHPFAGKTTEECALAYTEGGLPDIREYVPDIQSDFADWVMNLVNVNYEQRPSTTDEAMALLHDIALDIPPPDVAGLTMAVAIESDTTEALANEKLSLLGKWKELSSPLKTLLILGVLLLAVVLVAAGLLLKGKNNISENAQSSVNLGSFTCLRC